MDKYKMKSNYNLFIYTIEENKIKNDIINFMNFFLYKKNLSKKRKSLKNKMSKSFLLKNILLLIVIKFNLSSSQSINKKRNIILQSSSIKLKIENSGNQKIYSNGTYLDCHLVVTPDEIYINGENQNEIKNEYNFENNNNEIILKWYNPLEYTTCMFRDCTSITEIDLSNFDDSKLTQMQYMFYNCQLLKKIEMSNIKGYKVIDSGELFNGCTQLEKIDLANFNAPNNIYLHYMFINCISLISLNYPYLNTNNTQTITDIFSNCNNLKYINLENAIIKSEFISTFDIINSNHIICTHSPKLISIIQSKSATLNCENNYCINQIEDDDCSLTNYKYQYKNKFYENCPDGTYSDNFNCIDCNEKCLSEQDIIIKNLENYFISEDYNTTNIEQGEDEIYHEESFTITFTSSENQKNNINNNMTRINLGQCEIELRKFYNLSDDKILYMRKIDINIPGMKTPKVLFDAYCKLNDTNLIKLDLSLCQNSRVEISIPIKITENLDKLNSTSGYFNDICYITTSECVTDISLEDRRKDFIEGNKTICQKIVIYLIMILKIKMQNVYAKQKNFSHFLKI